MSNLVHFRQSGTEFHEDRLEEAIY